MMKILENLYEAGDRLVESKDVSVSKYGELFLDAAETIERQLDRLATAEGRVEKVNKEMLLISEVGLHQQGKVLPILKRQTEVLTEIQQVREILGIGKKDKDKKEKPDGKLKTVAQQLFARYSQAKSSTEKLDVIAALALLSVSPEMSSKALKISKSGGGDEDE